MGAAPAGRVCPEGGISATELPLNLMSAGRPLLVASRAARLTGCMEHLGGSSGDDPMTQSPLHDANRPPIQVLGTGTVLPGLSLL